MPNQQEILINGARFDYYNKLTEFLDETELAHKIEQGKLEVEEEDLREAFYKKRALYEEDIEELRREYAKTFE